MPRQKIQPADWPVLALATGFGSGFSPVASGTAGSLVGVAIFVLVHHWSWQAYAAFTAAVFIVGIPVSTRAEAIFGEKDSGKIVIDEIAGQLVALFAVPFSLPAVAAGFLLFRFFDIAKPFFRPLEKAPGGAGIMLDDLMAGFFTLAVLQAFLYHY
jgi:phosphatidylglycerophosphatase A